MRKLAAATLIAAVFTLVQAASSAYAVDLSGCWQGCWASHCTSHKGPLNATFVKQGEAQYCVHFQGRFFKVLPFKYSVTLDVIEETEDGITLSGSHYLGRMFGTFTYTATATDCSFTAHYSSCKDQGVFKLTKVANFSCCH